MRFYLFMAGDLLYDYISMHQTHEFLKHNQMYNNNFREFCNSDVLCYKPIPIIINCDYEGSLSSCYLPLPAFQFLQKGYIYLCIAHIVVPMMYFFLILYDITMCSLIYQVVI